MPGTIWTPEQATGVGVVGAGGLLAPGGVDVGGGGLLLGAGGVDVGGGGLLLGAGGVGVGTGAGMGAATVTPMIRAPGFDFAVLTAATVLAAVAPPFVRATEPAGFAADGARAVVALAALPLGEVADFTTITLRAARGVPVSAPPEAGRSEYVTVPVLSTIL